MTLQLNAGTSASKSSHLPSFDAGYVDVHLAQMDSREFTQFRTLVHERTGIWLREGKQVMLASRLSRRLRHHGLRSFSEYYSFVQSVRDNGDELRELINCVTTNKTSFFRERHHFDYLARTIVPSIRANVRKGAPNVIRIWSAACSTGEEPYSIAITLLEALRDSWGISSAPSLSHGSETPAPFTMPSSMKIEIFASDIDTNVLATARRAVYSIDCAAGINEALQKKYFLRGKDDMRGFVKVKPEVSRLVDFKRINLMDNSWPLDGLFDVIFFRNALIYFQKDTQELFLRKMARLLRPNGHLFLGNSEHVPWMSDVLIPLQQTMHQLREVAR